MDLASPPWVMNSQCIFEESHVCTIERVLEIRGMSFHDVTFHCILLHPSFLLIMGSIGGWKVHDIWFSLFDRTWLVNIIYMYIHKELIFFHKLQSVLLWCRSMRYTGYTWYYTHTILAALFCGVDWIPTLGTFLELWVYFGLSWSCGVLLGYFAAHTFNFTSIY